MLSVAKRSISRDSLLHFVS